MNKEQLKKFMEGNYCKEQKHNIGLFNKEDAISHRTDNGLCSDFIYMEYINKYFKLRLRTYHCAECCDSSDSLFKVTLRIHDDLIPIRDKLLHELGVGEIYRIANEISTMSLCDSKIAFNDFLALWIFNSLKEKIESEQFIEIVILEILKKNATVIGILRESKISSELLFALQKAYGFGEAE